MIERVVRHATITDDRYLGVSPGGAFTAWSDSAERRLWDVPGDGWVIAEMDIDFRVGGRERMRFGPPGAEDYIAAGEFLDIVPGARIISAGTMHNGETRVSSTLFTAEFYPEGTGTRLLLTDQTAYYYGAEEPRDRRGGWRKILDRLQHYLEDHPETKIAHY